MATLYIWLRRDGSWSRPVGLMRLRTVAAARVVAGRGPFTLRRDGELVARGRRLKILVALGQRLAKDEPGHAYRVRNGRGSIVFSCRVVAPAPAVDSRRSEMVRWCRWAIDHEGQIHYSQARPIPQYPPGTLPMTLDCSGSTITFARWAGAPDPSGYGFSGVGSTDSILRHAQNSGLEIQRRDLELGDLVLWAIGSDGKHVAVVIDTGDDPLMCSHGQEAGPIAIRLSAEDRYHAGEQVHYISLLGR